MRIATTALFSAVLMLGGVKTSLADSPFLYPMHFGNPSPGLYYSHPPQLHYTHPPRCHTPSLPWQPSVPFASPGIHGVGFGAVLTPSYGAPLPPPIPIGPPMRLGVGSLNAPLLNVHPVHFR